MVVCDTVPKWALVREIGRLFIPKHEMNTEYMDYLIGHHNLANNVFEHDIICTSCQLAIDDQFLFKIGSSNYHEHCIQCCVCKIALADRCFRKDNRIYCRYHYYNSFKCAGCMEGVNPSDMVYKLKTGLVYHVACHRCSQCFKPLTPGEQIVVDESTGTVSCFGHYPYATVSDRIQTVSVHPTFPIADSPSKNYAEEYSCSYSLGDDNKYLKRRGPRTTIKQDQLDVLDTIFDCNPKPSKHARAKLALETGLNMRVIQVWFQNKRSVHVHLLPMFLPNFSKERRLKHLCNYLRHFEQHVSISPSPSCNDAKTDGLQEISPSTFTTTTAAARLGMDFSQIDNHPFDLSSSSSYSI